MCARKRFHCSALERQEELDDAGPVAMEMPLLVYLQIPNRPFATLRANANTSTHELTDNNSGLCAPSRLRAQVGSKRRVRLITLRSTVQIRPPQPIRQTPDACREWLKTAPEALNFAPKFCPNGDILFELQFDQLGSPRTPEVKKPPEA